MTEDEFEKVLHKVLDSRSRQYEERHERHHEFLDVMIEEKRLRIARMEKVKSHVIGWGVVTSISGAGYALWIGVKNIFLGQNQ